MLASALERLTAQRAARSPRRDDLGDLRDERARVAAAHLHAERGGVPAGQGFFIVGQDEQALPLVLEVESKPGDAEVDVRLVTEGTEVAARRGRLLASYRALGEQPRDRAPEGGELLLLHPQRGAVGPGDGAEAEGPLPWRADGLGVDGVHEPKINHLACGLVGWWVIRVAVRRA